MKLKPIDFLQGPIYVDVWEGHGKLILNFADYHEFKEACEFKQCTNTRIGRMDHFLADWSRALDTRGKRVDCFVESQYPPNPEDIEQQPKHHFVDNYLSFLVLSMWPCYASAEKCASSCYYPNLRLHNVDARKIKPVFRKMYNASFAYQQTLEDLGEDAPAHRVLKHLEREHLHHTIQSLKTYQRHGFVTVKDILNDAMEPVNEHYNKIRNKQLRSSLERLIHENLRTRYGRLLGLAIEDVLIGLQNISGNSRPAYEVVGTFFNDLFRAGLSIQDAYCLAKLHSTLDGGRTPDHVVLYTGMHHTNFHSHVFKHLGYKRLWKSSKNTHQCLDLRDMNSKLHRKLYG